MGLHRIFACIHDVQVQMNRPLSLSQALCKQRDIPVMLLMVVRQSESAEVRLLGSQTLRRSLKLHWRQLSKEVELQMRPIWKLQFMNPLLFACCKGHITPARAAQERGLGASGQCMHFTGSEQRESRTAGGIVSRAGDQRAAGRVNCGGHHCPD